MKRLLIVLVALCLTACSQSHEPVYLKSKEADMSVYQWIEGDIADFQEVTAAEACRLFTEYGTGILLFGYDECPYCERAVPLLNEAAREANVTVYYIDVFNPVNDDSMKRLEGYIDSTFSTNSKGEKVFFVPEVIGIVGGRIVDSHVTLVDGWSPKSETDQMSDEQKSRLLNIYKEIIRKTAD